MFRHSGLVLLAGAAASPPLPPSHSVIRPVSLQRLVFGRWGSFNGPEEVGEAVAGLIRLRSAFRIAGKQLRPCFIHALGGNCVSFYITVIFHSLKAEVDLHLRVTCCREII